jgi:hypothetical protein
MLGNLNAKLGKQILTAMSVGTCDLHESNHNGNVTTSHA